MLKKFIFSLMAVIAMSFVVMAQDKPTELTGYIVDKACATGKVAKHEKPQEAAANETKGCILMPNCEKSGLGIYADGKYTEFDAQSAAKAKAALEKSKKDKGAKFQVTGKVADGKMTIASIKELTE
jgi:hypothetical protein